MPQVWTVSSRARVMIFAVSPLAGLISWARGNEATHALIVMALTVPLLAIFACYPKVTLTEKELIVRNTGGKVRVPLAEVVRVVPGYTGLAITASSRAPLLAMAVAKPLLAGPAGEPSRADRVAAAIMAAARRAATFD